MWPTIRRLWQYRVEFLVVLVIGSTLAALLVPAFIQVINLER